MTEKNELTLHGIAAAPGIVVGQAYVFTTHIPRIEEKAIGTENVQAEVDRLKHAVERSEKELQKILLFAEQKIGSSKAKIFEAQIMILNDAVLFNSIYKRIAKEKKNAEFIVNTEIMKYQRLMLNSADEYMRERAHDVEDIKNRIIRNIQQEKLISRFDNRSIIISESLTPADTVLFSRNDVLAYATDMGGNTSHAALLARTLKIPSVVGLKNITTFVQTGDVLIVDGYDGIVVIHPTNKTLRRFRERNREYHQFERKLVEIRDLPATTLDGKKIVLSSNIEFADEIDFIKGQGSDGVGLYRTEGLLIGREQEKFPSEDDQYQEYAAIAEKAYPHHVIMRTFDIGGDKVISTSYEEENPFLGWRGIRVSLDQSDMFLSQLQAMLRASVKKNIRILLPMVSGCKEISLVKKYLDQAKENLRSRNLPFDEDIKLGVMIEVPSAAIIAGDIAQRVDFLSIGTNDLIQYLLAVDRGNEIVSPLYQEFHPAVVRTIRQIIHDGHVHHKPVGMCGEMAGDPLATLLLIGLGLDEFSVIPTILPEIKKIIRSVSVQEAEQIAHEALELRSEDDIREFLRINLKTIVPDILLPE